MFTYVRCASYAWVPCPVIRSWSSIIERASPFVPLLNYMDPMCSGCPCGEPGNACCYPGAAELVHSIIRLVAICHWGELRLQRLRSLVFSYWILCCQRYIFPLLSYVWREAR